MQDLPGRIRAAGNVDLSCKAIQLFAFVLTEACEVADAWQAATEAQACAQALGDTEQQASAIVQMGMIGGKAVSRNVGGKAPAVHFQRALQVLGEADEWRALFRRLRESFGAVAIEGLPQPHGLSFSMGGAPDHPGVTSIDALITEADRCLYRAKSEGRDRVCVVD